MNKDAARARKIARWAADELVRARRLAADAPPEQQALARQLARAAKRARRKAIRRVSRALCRERADGGS